MNRTDGSEGEIRADGLQHSLPARARPRVPALCAIYAAALPAAHAVVDHRAVGGVEADDQDVLRLGVDDVLAIAPGQRRPPRRGRPAAFEAGVPGAVDGAKIAKVEAYGAVRTFYTIATCAR